MRQFKLWNASKTQAFDFATNGCIITDVSGLGLGFNVSLVNRAVVDYESKFENITLLANFGIKSNAYTSFNEFANFIASNGRKNLILEYAVNGKTVYCDVWIKNIPKSQKTTFNILAEKLEFVRLTYWYQIESGVLPTYPSVINIENGVMEDILVNLTVSGPTSDTFKVALIYGSTVLSEIKLNVVLTLDHVLEIDADNKNVKLINSGIESNGYNLIDHSKDTFIVVPSGAHGLSIYAGTGTVTYSFKKWVID
jgi:hypothetical protein